MLLNSPLFSENRTPLSLNLLLGLIMMAVLSILIMHARSDAETSSITWVMAPLTMFLFIAGWYMLYKPTAAHIAETGSTSSETKPLSSGGILLAGGGLLIGLLTTFMNSFGSGSYLILVFGFILLLFHRILAGKNGIADLILTPLMSAFVFLVSAGVLGNPSIAVFPAVIVLLLVFVLRVAMNAESEIRRHFQEIDEDTIFLTFRRRFAWTAGVFFLFGVVSFWPWLGMLYSDAYFWLLSLGVIIPLVFFWGRLRQPRSEGSLQALIRFNRVSPIIVCILMIAFAIG